ncbi:hypothetical protein GUITHDRAFT_107021 [Guillardia theta CCMP2712]|uniref:Uncharacterized protein n=1 Tax=Guillardia theta (strain CCMP2712) TaxID=905079 RepID=L1JEY9_GUITC|nr:hypothetical protein GUITHDRAFT_107021 [Guillardia theta CCMP2712]EKX47108.1 hypothetical protein GUITHDRAFT_107021 [Guillardia theta CCMP2712]|eukprot:XP_005834088.1 hypothetical protein GUITHDRAFT_107021 [Guillardia theta CCMP2712]
MGTNNSLHFTVKRLQTSKLNTYSFGFQGRRLSSDSLLQTSVPVAMPWNPNAQVFRPPQFNTASKVAVPRAAAVQWPQNFRTYPGQKLQDAAPAADAAAAPAADAAAAPAADAAAAPAADAAAAPEAAAPVAEAPAAAAPVAAPQPVAAAGYFLSMLSDCSASSDTVYLGGYMPQGYPPQGYAPQGYGYQAQPMYGSAASGCFAAQQCTGTYNEDRLSAEGVSDQLQSIQAQCSALTKMVKCMCESCETTAETDPSFVALHDESCSPAKIAEYHLAGGACVGFASGYCGLKLDQTFCENFAVPPVLGSANWLKNHAVVDPGASAATAGENLFKNQAHLQMPQYAQEVADSMSKYFTAGAANEAAKARLTNAMISQIEELRPAGSSGSAISGTPAGSNSSAWYCLGILC